MKRKSISSHYSEEKVSSFFLCSKNPDKLFRQVESKSIMNLNRILAKIISNCHVCFSYSDIILSPNSAIFHQAPLGEFGGGLYNYVRTCVRVCASVHYFVNTNTFFLSMPPFYNMIM